MIDILIIAGICVVFYFLGCLSTARVIARAKSLNIYKIGTGLADTENIYTNISKPLGILSGIADFGKMYLLILVLKTILFLEHQHLATEDLLFVYGFFLILGHCLPITHRFRGGRGIFTFSGLLFYFAPIPVIAVGIGAYLITHFYKQVRFSQYMMVLLPPLLSIFFIDGRQLIMRMMLGAVLMGIINFIVSKKMGEF